MYAWEKSARFYFAGCEFMDFEVAAIVSFTAWI